MKQKLFFNYVMNGTHYDFKAEVKAYKCSFQHIENDCRKTWKHFITVFRPCGSYESGIVHIYKTKKKDVYALVSYYDGSFYPLICYSKLNSELIERVKEYKDYLKNYKKNKKRA